MSIEILLKELVDNNVKLSVREDKLFCQLPDAGIDDKLLGLLKEHKEALKKMLLEKTSFKKYQSIPKTAEQNSYPLTASQKRLWVLSQFEGASQAYNMSFVTKITGELNFYFFEKAFRELIAHHEILRTVFKADEETLEVRQIVGSANEVYFSVETLDFSTVVDSTQKVALYLDAKNQEAFDLENGPLLSVSLLKIAENEFVFLLSMHHIISDGWSMEVIVAEVVQRYNTLLAGKENTIAAPSIQYKDYAVWVEAEKQNQKYQESEQFWVNKFAGDLTSLTLPGSKQRPAVQTFNGNHLCHRFSEELTAKMKLFSENNGVTLFTTLMTVVKALLYRYSGQDDITVGTPVAGREHPDLENQIGLYVNTLAIRTQFNEKNTFAALLQTEKDNLIAANQHQMYSLDELVKKLNLKKDLSRSSLFDVLVVFQNQSLLNLGSKKEDADNLSFENYDLGKKTAQFDISFNFSEQENQLELSLEYNTDIYDAPLITRIFSHFENFASKAIVHPNLFIEEKDYLSAEERQQLLFDFNDTAVTYPTDKTVVDLFEEQVAKTPNKVAVVFEEVTLTYHELNERANQLAFYLQENYAIEPDDLVGIQLERSERMIISIFGILKSGGAYIPIDVDYPQERTAYIISDAKLKLCIDESEFKKFSLVQESFSKTTPKVSGLNHHLAYCIYTSGSTGKPKGVLNHHAGLYNRLLWMKEYLNVEDNEVYLQKTPYTFDVSVWELILPFITGSALVIAKPEGHKDVTYLQEIISSKAVTVIHFVPSMLNAFLLDVEAKKGESLSHIICSGEELSSIVAQECKEKFKKARLHNLYGPTEASIDVTAIDLTDVDVIQEGVSIGKPVSNTSIYIVSNAMKPQPIGVAGELLISGIQVAAGYLNLPELTQERFIADPFKKGNQIYRTGDLALWNEDGSIKYLGRIDNQVKIRGNRIELGEVENALLEFEGIAQAVVTPKTVDNQKVLVAYYVSDSILDKKQIQSSLEKLLPEYMLPGFYIQLDTIPLTSSGKADKKALVDVSEKDLIKEEYWAPETTEEKVLVGVWAEILGVQKISIKDSFYNLGGDSIKSILVISKLKQQGYILKVDQILRNPVVEDLAKLLKSSTVSIDQSEVVGEVLLTPIQRYFFENTAIINKQHFNQAVLLKSKETIDALFLEQSVSALVAHHDALRMVYMQENKVWSQYNEDAVKPHYKIVFYDLRNNKDEFESLDKLGEELQTSFDISSGILFHVGHFRMSDGDRLALVLHHLVVDGVSWRILLEDLSGLYASFKYGSKADLPLKTDSYLRWSSALNDFAGSRTLQKERAYWETVTETLIASLPVDNANKDNESRLEKLNSFVLDKTITDKLQTKVHQVYKTDINDVLLTALGLSIQDVFGVQKTLIKMEGHGREDIIEGVDIGRTVGWFTSIYPFVLDVSDTNGHEIVHVKESLRQIPNKGVGYGILNYLDQPFENQLKPEIQFNYLGDFGAAIGSEKDKNFFEFSEGTVGSLIDSKNADDSILLDISGIIISGELNMSVGYSGTVFSEQTIGKFIQSYQHHLEQLITTLAEKKEKQLTPSDLTFKKLSYQELLAINADNNLEDVYELSPLQQGLYYHWQVDRSSPMYFQQFAYTLNAENLDIKLVEQAFNQLISRYSILRTFFTNNYGGTPLQIVNKVVTPDFSFEKTENNKALSVEEQLEEIKKKDRSNGFDFEKPSLMRLKVVEIAKDKYTFIWSHHHILMDGWCISILISDFTTILKALLTNQVASLAEPIQYSSYIDWLSQVDKEVSLEYWNTYLDGLKSVTAVPFKENKEQTAKFEIKEQVLDIRGEVYDKVVQFCKETDVTLNVFTQGVWGYLLSRYNNTNDAVFGSVVSGRPGDLLGFEDMIGLFINTIPVRLQYTNEDTPKSLFRKLQAEAIESIDHHHVNLAEVQSQSEFGMDLINSLMVFENYFVHAIDEIIQSDDNDSQKITVEEVSVFELTNYDFTIIIDTSSSLKLQFKYDESVYNSAAIANLATHFSNLVNSFIAEDNTLLGQIDYVTEAEKQQVLFDFNATAIEYPKDKTVVDLFEEQAAKTPDKVAVIFEDVTLTYAQLNEQTNQLAHYLQDNYKIQSDDLVGIKLDRSELMIVAIFGILKAGGAYVPIDVTYPEERIAYIASDAKLKLTLDESELEKFSLVQESFPKAAPKVSGLIDHLAYCIYTSGSTGKPKGVLNHHAGLYNRLLWMKDYLEVSDNEVYLQKTPYTFDVSVWELILPFMTGSTLVMAKPEGHKDAVYLQNTISEKQVSVIHFVPSMLNAFLVEAEATKTSSLAHVICSGEELSVLTANKCKEIVENAQLHNLYGPTEASIDVTAINLTKVDVLQEGVSIGKPVSNTSIYIVNDAFGLQPVGVPGELLISGVQVARGYLNLPELTQERFIADPFKKGNQIYRTGDVAYWKADGSIQYLGRIDNQVKIRGNRIELGEIEKVLMEFEGINQAVVIAKNYNDEKVLVAYYLFEKNITIDKAEIRDYLQERLPAYMHPGFYVELETLPMTSSGKVNRNGLPDIEDNDLIRRQYAAPQNETEEKLVAIWSEVLRAQEIGTADDFFALGGHSLMVAQVINRIHKQLGQTLSFSAFFENPTIQGLSQRLQNNEYQSIPKAPEHSSYPLTDSQSRLWILSQLEGGSQAYNMPAAVTLSGDLDVSKFNESFHLLIDRHEILRTGFRTNENGEIRQYITPSEEINFGITEKDFRALGQPENAIANYLEQIINTAFNLEKAPLLNASLIQTEEDQHVFFLCLHHIIGDGWSTELLIAEAIQIYNALTQGTVVNLPVLNIQYKDYAVWLKSALQQEKYQVSEQYWLEQFAGELPVLDLPSFRTRPLVQTYNGDYRTHQFSGAFLEQLKSFSKEQDVTLFMSLMAGVNALLHRYTGSDDIIVGTPIAGREHPDLENQMGLYLNTLAIRTRLQEKSSFLDLLRVQKETLLNAYDHQSYPFDALVGKLNLKRDTSRSALFDVLVVLQNQTQLNNLNAEELTSLKVSDYDFDKRTAQFDMSFTFIETAGLGLKIDYNTDIYDAYLIERIFVHFENLLSQFLQQPKTLIAEANYITALEKQEVLFDYNATAIEYPKDKTVLDLFEEQAAKTPDKIAVIFEDVTLTYAELNEQTNQLAHYLQDIYKIQADDLVGIQLDRSELMIVAIFGILKAGGAYVPIDVTYPEERIAYIASDAKLKLSIDENEFAKFRAVQESFPKTAPKVSGLIDHLAYCIYTSGSTGNPKGVLNHHAGLYNRLLWMKAYLEVGENEVYLQKTPYTFDVSVWELILPFMTGSTLVIARPEGHKDTTYLQEIISEKQVSIIHFVPSMLNAFLLEADEEKTSSLAHVICSGEELSVLTAAESKERFKNAQLHNLYGPTEASIDVTAINLTKVDVLQEGVSIGKPVSNTSIYIVNDAFGLQPVGVPGELLISGIQVARGYLNLPELTQDRFITDPFKTGNAIYRTGDVAYWKPDGSIQYLGRMDNQVKIRGNRIELGEIEKVLMQYDGVNQAVVIAKNYKNEKVLVAYYLLEKETEIDKAAIRTYLQEKLPAYMHPGFYVELESLPMTSSGKVNRNGLPDIVDNDLIRRQYVAPRNEIEEKLAAIWSEVLDIEKIGVEDDFFELGGHSLKLIKLYELIKKDVSQDVNVTHLFSMTTIQLQAQFINRHLSNSTKEENVNIVEIDF